MAEKYKRVLIGRLALPVLAAALLALALIPGATQQAATENVATCPVRMAAYLELYQYDTSLPLNPEEKLVEETDTYQLYHVLYDSTRNLRIPALLMLPKSPAAGPRPCIFFMHGYTSRKERFNAIFPFCVDAGCAAFAIDAQYHGERKIEGVDIYSEYIHRNRDAIIQTIVDARRGLDYLSSRLEIDPARIAVMGTSMGGIMASIFAGVDERLKAAVLVVAGGDWGLMTQTSQITPAKTLRGSAAPPDYDEIRAVTQCCDPLNFVGRISPRPAIFLNGSQDEIVPPPATKLLYEAAGEPKEIHWYESGHKLPQPEAYEQVAAWLKERL